MRPHATGFLSKGSFLAFGALALMIIGSAAQADTIVVGSWNFQCITPGANCLSSSQFQVVIENIGGQPVFTISNLGPVESSVGAIYWDDDSGLLNLESNPSIVGSSDGVVFSLDDKAKNFPGGNTVDFKVDVSESREGAASNGINPDEWLSVQFAMNTGLSPDVLHDAMDNGLLRMGLHVQAIGSLLSDGIDSSMMTSAADDPLPTPEPTSLLLLGTGIGIMGLMAHRRHKK